MISEDQRLKSVDRPFTIVTDLLSFLELERSAAPYAVIENPGFSFFVSRSFAERMRKRNWFDPLLLQVLPRGEEAIERQGFVADAVEDAVAQVVPGVLDKYNGRLLLLASGDCGVHCRFCFRRESPWRAHSSIKGGFADESILYCGRTIDVREVILSGGDPLCLKPETFDRSLQQLAAIPHLRTIRIHTRLPVVEPYRIGHRIAGPLAALAEVKNCVVVIHANHAAELTADCSSALLLLRSAGILLLNQSVLLQGINDSVDSLADLSCALLDHGVVPYYLHQLDRVRGSWHFEVPVKTGRRIMRELRLRLPGYAVPRYVREVPGEGSKTAL